MTTRISIKLPGPRVQKRYGITGRTLNRWKHDPELDFPEPITINGRDYYDESRLETWERQRAAASRGMRNDASSSLTGAVNQPAA